MGIQEFVFSRSKTGKDKLTELVDHPAANIWYYGFSANKTATINDPIWEIHRVYYRPDGIYETEYALNGEFRCTWTDRATYFSPTLPALPPTPEFSGTLTPGGLKTEGKISVITVNNIGWTLLPAIPLLKRKAMAIMNESNQKVKINYNPLNAGFVGMTIFANGGERQYNITDTIMIYAKSQMSSTIITVEELA